MTEGNRFFQLEQDLNLLYASAPLSDSFVNSLKLQLNSKVRVRPAKATRALRLRPVWIALLFLFVVIMLATLVVGPAKVYAEVRRLLGYIPGVGLVDTSVPIRVLEEQVEQTRDGVTITVISATLTSDRSRIDYRVFGVPRSAYPNDENVHGCFQSDYLLLPDGTKLERMNDFPAIPADVNEATLVIPCIAETLPGTAPENWEFQLKFIAAPPELTVMPVVEGTPTLAPTSESALLGQPTTIPMDNSVSVSQVIETETGYILVGEFTPQAKEGEWIQTIGMPVFDDANGENVPLKMNLDAMNNLQTGPNSWVYEINAVGVSFPITITFSGVAISQPDASASVEIPFDFGESVMPGQEWQPDLQFDLAGHTVRLVKIIADSRGGYSFNFEMEPDVYGVRVEIKGYTPNGGGGGGGGGLTEGKFNTSRSYAETPTGIVTLVFSNLTVISDPLTWQGSWSPANVRTDLPATYELPEGTCGDVNTLQSIPTLPASITGKVLVYEKLLSGDEWGLVLYNLDGSERRLVQASTGWGALSADGNMVTYSIEGGFEVYDVIGGTVASRSTSGGYNPVWSHDGTRYAFVRGAAEGVSVMELSTGIETPVSSLGWETVVGWLPDDSRLIIAAMYSGGVARQIRSVDPQTGQYEDLFLIEDASYKALNATLSPNGQWIAYRARNNSGVRIMKMDGSQRHLLLDDPSAATSGILWSEAGWLGVSLIEEANEPEKLILINPDDCAIYQVSEVGGTLMGLFVQ